MRLFLKIVYAAVAVVFGVFIAIIFYQSNVYQEIHDKTVTWLNNGDYENIGRLYFGYFDSKPLFEDSSLAELKIYASTQEETFYYYTLKDGAEAGSSRESDYDKKIHHVYDYTYDLLLYLPASKKSNISMLNRSVGDKVLNGLSVRFYDSKLNKSYDYKFEVTSSINTDDYINRPNTEEDAALHGSRNYKSGFYDSWGFYRIHLNQFLINTINKVNNMNVDSFNITDTSGNNVYETNFTFDFSFEQQFFKDIAPLHKAYADYINIYNDYNYDNNKAGISKEAYDTATEKFKTDLDSWKTTSANYPTYLTAFAQSDVVSSTPIWKTVGMMALYLLAIAILYIIFFEFKRVKSFIFKDRSNHQRYVPNKMPDQLNNKGKGNNNNNKETGKK